MSDDHYDGPVGFGSDGVHYPLDAEGHLDLERPLRWVADDPHPEAAASPSGQTHDAGGFYRYAVDGEPLHFDQYHVNHVEVEFEDAAGEPIRVSEEEAAKIRALLDGLRGNG